MAFLCNYTTVETGGGSNGSYSRIGEEFGIVLQGETEVNVNRKPYRVKKNQRSYFSSQELHRWSNPGKKKAIVIWGVSPATF